jgi:hypothetical protein
MDTRDKRRLIETFPGLPPGAGIYELEDGSHAFFNCAPGGPLPDPEELVDFDPFYQVVDPDNSRIQFDINHAFYKTLKNALLSAGKDIDSIATEEELYDTISIRGLGYAIQIYIEAKWRNRKPKTLQQALTKAIILNDITLAQEIRAKIKKRNSIGLRRIK